MNFAHGELYMLGAYAGIAVIGVTQSFWVALVAAPLAVGVVGAVTEVATLRPLYRREPLYGLILTFGLALVFREGVRQIWGGDMRRILPPFTGSTPLLGMTYPNYRLFLLAFSSRAAPRPSGSSSPAPGRASSCAPPSRTPRCSTGSA